MIYVRLFLIAMTLSMFLCAGTVTAWGMEVAAREGYVVTSWVAFGFLMSLIPCFIFWGALMMTAKEQD